MVKNFKIGDKELTFKSSAAIPHIYRRQFNRDIFIDMDSLQKELKIKDDGSSELSPEYIELFENLAYCFAKHADSELPDDPLEWLGQFEMFDIYNLLPEIISMWTAETVSTSRLKKKKD